MARNLRIFGAISLALATALPAASAARAAAAAPQAHRTISNTATIAWDIDGKPFSLASNQVDLLVSPQALTPLATYRPSASGEIVSMAGAGCSGSAAAASTAGAQP